MFEHGGAVSELGASGMLSGVPESQWSAVLREQHAVIARAQFLEVDAIATIYLTRCAEDERRGCNEAFQGEFASAEVGFVYRWSERAAERVIGLSIDLRWRLHATSAEFAAGRIDQQRAQTISDALANVSENKVELIERMLLDGSEDLNLPKLRAKARRLIARHDPEGATSHRRNAEAERDVRIRPNEDGTCAIEGTLPGPGGQIVATRLRRMCFQVCGSDPRTFAQRRADALVALASGAGHLACVCGRDDCTATGAEATGPDTPNGVADAESVNPTPSARHSAPVPPLPAATIHVGVNATTLLGLDDLPGYLAGHGWIDADLAREIAADGTWRKVLTLTATDGEAILDALSGGAGRDGATGATPHGHVLGIGRALAAASITPETIRERSGPRREQLTYRPSQQLADTVRARDGVCRFPGCTVRAMACDLDHTVPFDHDHPEGGGLTVEQNLACLCRRHHRLKTRGDWQVRQLGAGTLEWTTPTGEHAVTEPAGGFTGDEQRRADEALAAAHGFTLTDEATLSNLFYSIPRPRRRIRSAPADRYRTTHRANRVDSGPRRHYDPRRIRPCWVAGVSRPPGRRTRSRTLLITECSSRQVDIARDLVAVMRRDIKTDWTQRDDVKAKLRSQIKRLLVRHGYPPDQQPAAIKLVLEQMEIIAPDMAA